MNNLQTKYFLDKLSAIFLGFILLPLIFLVSLLVLSLSRGPILYWSKRIGKDNVEFMMPKFRTMRVETPDLATHLLKNPKKWLIPFGGFLRSTSLDEMPQLWSILRGQMTFVGPRPALFNQYDLIKLRTEAGVHKLKPGITGLAQINGRDSISIEEKVKFDKEYMINQSSFLDLRIVLATILKIYGDKNVSH